MTADGPGAGTARPARVLRLGPEPIGLRPWLADLAAHRGVLAMLARKDFQTRYKRASMGVAWAVALPVLQGVVLAVVFSRLLRFDGGDVGYGAYVLSGMLPWAYFASTLPSASTAIVDNASLTDKVWFPRALLVAVPVAANVVGLAVSVLVFLFLVPVLGGELGVRLVLLVPGAALLVAFTAALGLVLSALYVYFRDVKFLLQAALLVWLYVTPIIYPRELLGAAQGWLDLNPVTGAVVLFHAAVGVQGDPLARPVLASVAVTVVLGVVGTAVHRRHDRLFVDQL